jgi:hypothetical protein
MSPPRNIDALFDNAADAQRFDCVFDAFEACFDLLNEICVLASLNYYSYAQAHTRSMHQSCASDESYFCQTNIMCSDPALQDQLFEVIAKGLIAMKAGKTCPLEQLHVHTTSPGKMLDTLVCSVRQWKPFNHMANLLTKELKVHAFGGTSKQTMHCVQVLWNGLDKYKYSEIQGHDNVPLTHDAYLLVEACGRRGVQRDAELIQSCRDKLAHQMMTVAREPSRLFSYDLSPAVTMLWQWLADLINLANAGLSLDDADALKPLFAHWIDTTVEFCQRHRCMGSASMLIASACIRAQFRIMCTSNAHLASHLENSLKVLTHQRVCCSPLPSLIVDARSEAKWLRETNISQPEPAPQCAFLDEAMQSNPYAQHLQCPCCLDYIDYRDGAWTHQAVRSQESTDAQYTLRNNHNGCGRLMCGKCLNGLKRAGKETCVQCQQPLSGIKSDNNESTWFNVKPVSYPVLCMLKDLLVQCSCCDAQPCKISQIDEHYKRAHPAVEPEVVYDHTQTDKSVLKPRHNFWTSAQLKLSILQGTTNVVPCVKVWTREDELQCIKSKNSTLLFARMLENKDFSLMSFLQFDTEDARLMLDRSVLPVEHRDAFDEWATKTAECFAFLFAGAHKTELDNAPSSAKLSWIHSTISSMCNTHSNLQDNSAKNVPLYKLIEFAMRSHVHCEKLAEATHMHPIGLLQSLESATKLTPADADQTTPEFKFMHTLMKSAAHRRRQEFQRAFLQTLPPTGDSISLHELINSVSTGDEARHLVLM